MRLYNGCPDSDLKAHWDEIDELKQRLQRVSPGALCTCFPADGVHQVWTKGNKPVGEWGSATPITALHRALTILEGDTR